MTYVLGISAFYHDAAAALVADGEIVGAVQEERFTRRKYDERFPARAIAYCLEAAGIGPEQLDVVAFYEKPLTKFERLLETYVGYAPRGFASFRRAMPVWLKLKLHLPRVIRRALSGRYRGPILFPTHHESHAASAYFPSPFERAAILTMDGVGEWTTTTVGVGEGARIRLLRQLAFPHSLGLLYSAFTYYCGFAVNSGEYKLMGLAPYGEPRYVDLIHRHLVDVRPDGSFHLDMSYFNYCQGLTMTSERFHRLFGGPPRAPDSPIEQRHTDLAHSIQVVCEEVVLGCARQAWNVAGRPPNLVLAGGVALNCVANARLLREGPFEHLWVQPAAGDAGGALGAALFVAHQLLGAPRGPRTADTQRASLLGPAYADAEVRRVLEAAGARYRRFEVEDALLERVVAALVRGEIVGWFSGRAEFGPRALTARSIIADPRNPRVQSVLNLKIKFRESFRPFAPVVLREHAHEWFETRPDEDAPYMVTVAPVRADHRRGLSREEEHRLRHDTDLARRVNVVRSDVPAVTHVDYSARIQTIDARHGRFRRLLERFHARTGCPVLVNTSFNLSWEPIVLTPAEAYRTFMQSEMDVLVLEDCFLHKAEQPLGLQPWANPAEEAEEAPGLAVASVGSRALRLPRGPRPWPEVSPDSPWIDPETGDALRVTRTGATNVVTGRTYPVVDGIPCLFVSETGAPAVEDVTDAVRRFYEETPFPNYDDFESVRALIEKARRGLFARLLNDHIRYDARVVDIGCGTGQLTNFLAIAHRTVIGVDVCLNSLRLAQDFRARHGLERATFAQMNLFRPALRDGFFDYVIASGVLHHTLECREAFRRVGRLVRPGGHLIVGLYSAFSRQLHYGRRALYRATGWVPRWVDPHLARVRGRGKREAWLRDQYCHPHETCHTLDEVLGWLDADGFEFVNSVPKPAPGPGLTPDEDLFGQRSRGNRLSRWASQLAHLPSGYREGGFFLVIGRRAGEGT